MQGTPPTSCGASVGPYYRARYYDPTVGRFLSEDPIRFEGGIGFYIYTRNSPTLFTDPFGLEAGEVDTLLAFFPGSEYDQTNNTIKLPQKYCWKDVVQRLNEFGFYHGLLAYNPWHHRGGLEFRLPGPNPGFHFKLRYPSKGACGSCGKEALIIDDIHYDQHNPVGNGFGNTFRHAWGTWIKHDEWVRPDGAAQ